MGYRSSAGDTGPGVTLMPEHPVAAEARKSAAPTVRTPARRDDVRGAEKRGDSL